DRKSDQVETEFTMNGPPQKRSYSWRSLEQQGPSELTKDLNPEAAQAAPLAMLGIGKAHSLRWYGASTRLEHNGRKIEALLIETEGDPDYWVKIWITPTGEILRMRTSPLLGLSAENRSLLEPAEDTAKP
ncbi:MAG: hypothetical protein JO317_00965, partial [Verrucomicrobiae bacterium]|nr:hypothetical protein [Verrucomicrobiae bacterium]